MRIQQIDASDVPGGGGGFRIGRTTDQLINKFRIYEHLPSSSVNSRSEIKY